ncbi:unnamed protein product [Bursaphelenchus xylophilus]|uniref:(pine wood nematode) hypothetical protein n=1 Tax=Bursaphelenchus xylophilus TaxID=6326 RepID=A0A1I7RXX3_BURXY|nr:unnamed protein product [Bursaphelenchus xylophilus]CAG9125231.1 unnamed protein product [Bursaphelenchus xylophilus]
MKSLVLLAVILYISVYDETAEAVRECFHGEDESRDPDRCRNNHAHGCIKFVYNTGHVTRSCARYDECRRDEVRELRHGTAHCCYDDLCNSAPKLIASTVPLLALARIFL